MAVGYTLSCWLLWQVADLVLENTAAPDWIMQVIMLILALGFPVVVFFSWANEATPEGIKRESEIERDESITHVTVWLFVMRDQLSRRAPNCHEIRTGRVLAGELWPARA